MATVFDPPTYPPELSDYGFDRYQEYQAACDAWADELAASLRQEHPTADTVGEIIRFPYADGQAAYMVAQERPLQLIHLNFGDGYAIPEAHERGLRLSDIRDKVNRSRSLAALVEKRKAELDTEATT